MDVQRRDFLFTGALAATAMAAAAAPARAQTPAGPGQERGGSVRPGDEKVVYEGGKEVKKLKIINTAELEIEAEKNPAQGWLWLHLRRLGRGVYESGKSARHAGYRHRAAFPCGRAEARFVDDDPRTQAAVPDHDPARWEAMVWRMCRRKSARRRRLRLVNTLMMLSMQSNVPLEDVAKAHPGPKWMQLYFPADRGYAREVIMRAKAAGFSAIVPTIDSTLAYPRDNNIRNDFRIPVSLGKGNAPLNEKGPDQGRADDVAAQSRSELGRHAVDQAGDGLPLW
jgi:hypothetical protein